MKIPLLKDAKNLKGKRVLLRVDLNIPVENGAPKDDYRILKILPTIEYLKKQCKEVIVLSHHSDAKQSLELIYKELNTKVSNYFIRDIFNDDEFVTARKSGEKVFVCENIRFWEGEKENDSQFTENLSLLGDVYVNDAFSVSHRKHSSIVGLPSKLPSYAGFFFEKEVQELSRAFHPEHPFLFVLGGAKPETKIPLIEKFLESADKIFVGGALVDAFFRECGYEIGNAVAERIPVDIGKLLGSKKIVLPKDIVVKNEDGIFTKKIADISAGDDMLDIGPETISELKDLVNSSRFILWNGPLGDYLKPGLERSSVLFAKAVKESNAKSIAGGGDTVTLLRENNLGDSFGFLSSGGGAMLMFLAAKTLPGIEALETAVRSKK